jgi:hexokinase
VQLLQDALDRKQVPVKCSALVNDTVGTLLSRAYQSGAAFVGAIFGTGTNGAYLERMSSISKKLPVPIDFEYMIINTEWGAFDNEVCETPYEVLSSD